MTLDLEEVPGRFAVCRFAPGHPVGEPAGRFWSATRTADELSLVCAEEDVPPGGTVQSGWRCFRVRGSMDFSQVGVLSSVLTPLRDAGIGIFAVSTFDTDYVFVPGDRWDAAIGALTDAGHGMKNHGSHG